MKNIYLQPTSFYKFNIPHISNFSLPTGKSAMQATQFDIEMF